MYSSLLTSILYFNNRMFFLYKGTQKMLITLQYSKILNYIKPNFFCYALPLPILTLTWCQRKFSVLCLVTLQEKLRRICRVSEKRQRHSYWGAGATTFHIYISWGKISFKTMTKRLLKYWRGRDQGNVYNIHPSSWPLPVLTPNNGLSKDTYIQ